MKKSTARKKSSPKRPKRRSKSSKKKSPFLLKDISGIFIIFASIMIAIAIITFNPEDPPNGSSEKIYNQLGPVGAYISSMLINFTFGRWISLIVPLLTLLFGIDLVRGKGFNLFRFSFWRGISTAIIATLIWAHVLATSSIDESIVLTGFFSMELVGLIIRYLGKIGSYFVVYGILIVYLILTFNITWMKAENYLKGCFNFSFGVISGVASSIANLVNRLQKKRRTKKVVEQAKKKVQKKEIKGVATQLELVDNMEKVSPPIPDPAVITNIATLEKPAPVSKDDIVETEPDPATYRLPSIELLNVGDQTGFEIDEEMLRNQASMLEDRLREFGVSANVVAIHPGPVITRYDLKPAAGVKVSRIVSLADDLALSLSANSLRIIAPIPGAGAVGIEVPNLKSQTVYIRDVIASDTFQNSDAPLTIALGKNAQGEDFTVDLTKMPHLLIAGTTGAGKSVCINTIVTSLLMRNHPKDVMIAMVDPKKIELSIYAELRRHHLLFLEDIDEVIATVPKNAVALLQSVVREMEARYDRLAETGARNLIEFNNLVEKGKVQPDDDGKEPQPLPYIVMIIDELADLMLTAAKEVEEPIARLAQMARAVGIHLVVATQRPSVDVITGVIKANFPSRIAFMVATKIDSRTIIDRPGADALLGRGDGLYLSGTSPQPTRFHCSLITTEEVHRLIAHVHNQPAFIKPTKLSLPDSADGDIEGGSIEDRDILFPEAVKVVARHQQGSVSLLQRRLKIGYSRAGRVLDQLEQAGIVGPFEGSKAREVYLDQEDVESFLAGPARMEDPLAD